MTGVTKSSQKLIRLSVPDKVCHCDQWQWVDCNFCSSGDFAIHYYAPYPWVTLSVVKCRNCGHVFTNPVPTKPSIENYYSTDYALSSNRDYPPSIEQSLDEKGPWAWRHQEFTYKLKILNEVSKLSGPLLEVGPGWGGMLYHAHEMGVQDLHALDVSARALKYIQGQLRCQIHQGFLSEADLKPNSFRTVIANNYIEHSLSPNQDIDKIRTILKDHGLLLLALPNFNSFLSRQQGPYWRAIRGGNHYHHFTPDFLVHQLEVKGFSIKHLSTTSKFYHWPKELNFELSMRFNGQPSEDEMAHLEKEMLGEEIIIVASKA